jgi:hypothetical protein
VAGVQALYLLFVCKIVIKQNFTVENYNVPKNCLSW